VLQIDPNPRPRVKSPAHRVDQHVGGLQMRGGVGVPRLPSLQSRERIVLALRAGDLDQRELRRPPF